MHYWSSEGSEDVSSSEELLYQLAHPICLVSSLTIEFYQAHWQLGQPVYCPQTLRVAFYLGTNLQETISLGPVQRTPNAQVYPFSRPIVANQIRLILEGRTAKQPSDELWYTVVQYVEVMGRTLPSLKDKQVCQALVNYASRFITKEDLQTSFFPTTNFSNGLEYYLSCPRFRKSANPVQSQ